MRAGARQARAPAPPLDTARDLSFSTHVAGASCCGGRRSPRAHAPAAARRRWLAPLADALGAAAADAARDRKRFTPADAAAAAPADDGRAETDENVDANARRGAAGAGGTEAPACPGARAAA